MNRKSRSAVCHSQSAIPNGQLAIGHWLSAAFRNLQRSTYNLPQRSVLNMTTKAFAFYSLSPSDGERVGVRDTPPRFLTSCIVFVPLNFLTGCQGAPSINFFGSFFPAWMLCVAFGVIGVLVLRRVFVRAQIEPHLGNLPLVYFALWVLLTLGIWLLFFREL